MLRIRISRALKKLERPYEVFNRIEVSRSALLHNAAFFAAASDLQVIPVLKGNAYGHGIEQVATALKGQSFPYLAVDGYFEALRVRAFNRNPVLVMGMIKPQNIPKLQLAGLAFVVQDETTIKAFGSLRKSIKIHLDINTGMNRYGIRPEELNHYLKLIKSLPNLKLEGVMSHLADPDGPNDQTIHQAVEQFDACVEQIMASGFQPKFFHTTQTAASLRAKSRHANTMRLGLGLYGVNPFPANHQMSKTYAKLRPALCLISTISKIQQLQAGGKVSYNYTFTAPHAMAVGILPLGYHEAVPDFRAAPHASQPAVVKLGQYFQPIVGRVCMNHTIISLEGRRAKVGDEVVVFSNNPADPNSVASLAAGHKLFIYSLLTGLSPDVRRYLVE